MLLFSESQTLLWISQYLLPLIRITALFLAAPIFGSRIVSLKVRCILALLITWIIAPLLPPTSIVSGINLFTLVAITHQIITGIALGFIFQILFQLFILSGQFIAMKMGLSFGSMNDPINGVSVTVISQFYLLTTTLVFINFNGHLALIKILIDSFSMLPIGAIGFTCEDSYKIVQLGSWMFSGALTISLPILTGLLVVNIAFGVISRSAPQINIFSVGFPMTLIFGLMIMWIGFSAFLESFQEFINKGIFFSVRLLI